MFLLCKKATYICTRGIWGGRRRAKKERASECGLFWRALPWGREWKAMERGQRVYRNTVWNGGNWKDLFPVGRREMDEKRDRGTGGRVCAGWIPHPEVYPKAGACGRREHGGREEAERKLQEWIQEGNRKKLEEWTAEVREELTEKDRKKLAESWNYIKNNWKGNRKRVKKEEGVIGSSTEGHISHVLSARMSSRPMGWCRQGADSLSRLRIHWINGGDIPLSSCNCQSVLTE